ncbi:OTU domain-containing protein 6A [Canis lupus baileyi]|uniref:ubiquitinyl hydrolase 1 n=2 Tax=Canis lupus familiaris TaxID=9615 RepID=A0A8C0N235_CANLF|nr:OTU domain-containing protein 6A [Canis lupus dingo]XP_038304902.1 OTU domain-containing protein 6A [Canis lupus familiaris]XP_038442453.1 OTU domain-containing protein 6A [Canis lupus familiaris]XP_549057.3 OTU domain-containing protein 6A [Canis lupus familiaris]|eukprot:XP_549057.3 OTU domain-containing protein 6A [Canis lupus familiaris]
MEDSQSEQQRVIRRHHREKSELQARIQGMKNSVPKSDKKRRKQLLLDVARLEAEMEQKHQQELEKFQESFPANSNVDSVTEDLAKMDLENQPPRLSRARRRRERRARQERIAEAETQHLASFRREEEEKLAAILGSKNLELKNIPADGHCMYRAIQDQLVFSVTVESLRSRTADYMRKHVDDFLPFFSDPDTGDAYSREDFLSYCDDIVRSPSWGGQLELRALSHVLQTPIEVIQADSPAVLIGEEYTKKPLTLVHLRYACNLGEHYNSVKPLEAGAVGGAAPRLF